MNAPAPPREPRRRPSPEPGLNNSRGSRILWFREFLRLASSARLRNVPDLGRDVSCPPSPPYCWCCAQSARRRSSWPEEHRTPRWIRTKGERLDILPAMNDQDSNRSPGGNVLRFALHRQGQNSQVSTRCHAMPCRGSLLVLPNSVGLGYRRAGLNVQPSTDRRKGFLPALHDRVSTLGVR